MRGLPEYNVIGMLDLIEGDQRHSGPDVIRPIGPARQIVLPAHALCLLLAAILFHLAPAIAQSYAPLPASQTGGKIVDKPNAQVPLDLTFTDESGSAVKLATYFQPNRPVLLVMVYFGCPKLCSVSLNGVTEAVRKIKLQPGRDFEMVTVSFDPKEGPELAASKKANYIKSLGNPEAAAGWHFLTSSDPAAAKALGDAIGFGWVRAGDTDNFDHEAGIYFCTPDGRVSRVQRGTFFEADMVRDSLINASQGKISSGLFGVALTCGVMQFDAVTGKYALAAIALVRIAGIGTLIALASGIGWMLYRESRRKAADPAVRTAGEGGR
jgi:protein SCO1